MKFMGGKKNNHDIQSNGSKDSEIGLIRVGIFLASFLKLRMSLIFVAIVAMAFAAGSILAVPFVVKYAIDSGLAVSDLTNLADAQNFLIIIAVVMGVSSAVRYFAVTMLGEKVVADMRQTLFRHILQLPNEFFENIGTGTILSRLNADVAVVRQVMTSSLSMAMRSFVTMIGAIIMMMITSLKLSAIAIIAVPLGILPLVLLGKRVRKLSRRAQGRLASSNQLVHERISAIKTVQAYCREKSTASDFSKALLEVVRTTQSMAKLRGVLTALITFVGFSCFVLLISVGGNMVITQEITGGELGQFLLFTWLVISGFLIISDVWGDCMLAVGAIRDFIELIEKNPVETNNKLFDHSRYLPVALEASIDDSEPFKISKAISQSDHTIEFSNIGLIYPSRPESYALQNISFRVETGEKVAIVGGSGAGKSSVFNLIMMFINATKGEISIGGHNINDIPVRELRKQIAIVLQDSALFSDTIAENIRFGRQGASEQEVIEAAKAARADEFIEQLENSYDTKIGDTGTRLSGGQSQRLSIARAFVRKAPILLMDEATSALDPENEYSVRLAMRTLMKNRTVIVIAHRLATVLEMDRIIMLDRGKIVATGTHKDLYVSSDTYQRFVDLQLSHPEDTIA